MVGIGVPLLVRSNLGVAPFDVLNTGLNEVTELSFGLCFVLMSSKDSVGGGPYIVEADYPLRGRRGLESRYASAI